MGLADQLSEIKKLPKSRLDPDEPSPRSESIEKVANSPVPSTGKNDKRIALWKRELELIPHIDLLIEDKASEIIISKEAAIARHEIDANRESSLEIQESEDEFNNEENKDKSNRGRPKKKKINKSSLLRLSSPPWFKKVLKEIMDTKNKSLTPGQKKWGLGRAVIFIYHEYRRLKEGEKRRDQKIAKKILELNIRSLQTRDPDLLARHGERALKVAFLNEVKSFSEMLKVCGVNESDLKTRLSREVARRYQEVLMHYEIVKREVI